MANSKVFKKILTSALSLLLVVVLLVVATGCNGDGDPKETQTPIDDTVTIGNEEMQPVGVETDIPKLNASDKIIVVNPSSTKGISGGTRLSKPEQIMLVSLQGLVAQTNAEIYIGKENDLLLEYMKTAYGKTVEVVNDMKVLLERYKSHIKDNGYIKVKYSASAVATSTLNQACTLAGIKGWLVVPCEKNEDDKLESAIKDAGFTMKEDLYFGERSLENEFMFFKNHKSEINTKILAALNPKNIKSRDFGIANKAAFYYYKVDTTSYQELLNVYGSLNPLASIVGWEDVVSGSGTQEGASTREWINKASYHGIVAMPVSEMHNLSLLSAVKKGENLQQKASKSNAADNVHIATIIYNNGENIADFIDLLGDNKYFGNGDKATYPVGWTISPSIFDLAEPAIHYAYANMTDNEHFVAAVSGFAPSDLITLAKHNKGKTLDAYMTRTNDLMGKTGLSYVSYMGSIKDSNILNKYGALSNVKGGFVLSDDFVAPTGGVKWVNNKPFVADREIVRENTKAAKDQDKELTKIDDIAAKVAERLGQYKIDQSNIEGYSVVQVYNTYSFTKAVTNIYKKADSSKVKFVTPDEFLKMIESKVEKKDVESVEVLSVVKK